MGRFIKGAVVVALIWMWASASMADEVGAASDEPDEGIDEQVQALKKESLRISAELTKLQEKLMYPSDSQVALFVTIALDEEFPLESIAIEIDGKDAADHVYTAKELEAMQHGGVQRVYTGNLLTGTHMLDMVAIGKPPGKDRVKQSAKFKFYKSKGPKAIEIILSGDEPSFKNLSD